MRVLLVDDSEDFLASATRLLESQGLEVVGRAGSGKEALELVDQLDPDLVLVDIELGQEDGIALTHALRARTPEAAIVLTSAYERDDLAELIGGSSAAGFVPKRSLSLDAIEAILDPA
jgi:two-component system, NarL family, nitrate/nitrite response regulator NarL